MCCSLAPHFSLFQLSIGSFQATPRSCRMSCSPPQLETEDGNTPRGRNVATLCVCVCVCMCVCVCVCVCVCACVCVWHQTMDQIYRSVLNTDNARCSSSSSLQLHLRFCRRRSKLLSRCRSRRPLNTTLTADHSRSLRFRESNNDLVFQSIS